MTGARVMIIDDDNDFLDSLHLLLMRNGYNVLAVTNGQDALDKYGEFKPDVVFLDVKMPHMDGYAVFSRLKRVDPKARIVFTSNYRLDDSINDIIKSSPDVITLSKPIEMDTVHELIRGQPARAS